MADFDPTASGTGPRGFVPRLVLAMEPLDLSESARDIVIAHAAHESGWGRGLASRLGHNHWNLTRTLHDDRPIVHGGDMEPDGHGGWRKITQRFRAYPSDFEACVDYLAFLRESKRYAPAYAALLAGNAAEFVRRLHDDDPATPAVEGGFFTADLAGYQQGVAACLSMVRHILRPEGVA